MALTPPGQARLARSTTVRPQPAPAPKKTPPKKPPTRPVGAADPAGAVPTIGGLTVAQLSKMTPAQILQYQALYEAQGPNYSQVPKVDFGALQQAAWQQAGAQVGELTAPYQAERERLKGQLATSREAATNFSAAFASIAGGGNAAIDDPAAQRYALENWGGSYVGGMAASLGAQLVAQLSSQFTARDAEYAGKILEIMDKRPDIAESIYKEVADDAAAQISEGRTIAEMSYKNQLGALATFAKAMGGTDSEITYVTQPGGGVVGFDKRTGEVVYTIPGTGSSGGGSSDTRLRSAGGKVYEQDPVTGKWKVAIDPGAGGSDEVQPRTTPSAVTKIGERALEKVTDKIWGMLGAPPETIVDAKSGKEVPNPAYAKAEAKYQAWLDSGKSFKSAMTRVISAIGPSLRKQKYTTAQINEAAYRIVAAEMDPPKGYKVPTAKTVANTWDVVTPKTGVVTSKGWSATHVTDNLGWGTKTAGDIMAKPGTPVGAPEDGTIVRHGSAQGGQSLYFQGRSGKLYWLGHIDGMLPPGTTAREDQPIAVISADHANPHLHIDVRGGSV